ncbi:MAG: 50S ribosomal protein L34e [Candidatus Bathyarchaeia archaeon]
MPRPYQRTRSRKRVLKALPGGRTGLHFKREVPRGGGCAKCGKPLSGVPRLLPHEIRKLNKTKRSISRIYGGHLCHNCLKTALKQAVQTLSAA